MLVFRITKLALILILVLFAIELQAKNLGKRGRSFEITEQGFVAMMEARLKQVDMKKEQKKMVEIGKKRVLSPAAVAGIVRASKNREFYHDPTYILPEDASLPCGKVLHPAGTMVNPLDVMKLERRIFFINGKDEEQVAWLLEHLKDEQEEIGSVQDRVILVAGSPVKLSERLGREIYFDQHDGFLTKKWGIKAVPAIVIQEKNRLKIMERRI
ncbi:MAG: conjugal transfer protein TraW [Gammaproteobacteria bacterium]|nr:conjugal transfer protein TraW [Gammaproteobacteria bacterium]